MIKLYHVELSGNSYKVRLMLSLLGIKHEQVLVDLRGGEHKSPQFLKLNPFGQIPVLVDRDVVVRDSHAILVYLARRYGDEDWLPTEAQSMSKVMGWLFTAANEIRQGPEFARRYHLFQIPLDVQLATQRAYAILKILDEHLTGRQWLELNRPTVADVACFPYIALAPDGKVSLDAYPNIIAWIKQIKQLPGYVGMPGL
ncbi:glutathione S-transferase family protein [Brasilonema octagenarum]|uniref:Glutathione S-transferase n=1 Tax=Brasilonema octagenarum UFV-OR1 TaxID=417115 RepID=A0ABX1MBN8_9CYAN|nr:glutathione S-transferase [Brasilonema octagenarum]NMF64906.1 glutathione S-transferase [Brasilonema octagenarum UFV-OR1]